MKKLVILSILLSPMISCFNENNESKKSITPHDEAPLWAQEAIWYQIFVERFYNGNKENDPDLITMKGALIDEVPKEWTITPWTQNWYSQEEWAKKTGLDFYRTIQMRRYGGDLKGVKSKIPYLKSLGINAVYFNPLNDAPSLHKYDARNYHHIDVTFGDDKEGDIKMIENENKDNPREWIWTNADKLFLEIIKEFHDNGIKVVLDYSWNHTGTQFWAFKDLAENGVNSKYKDWYEVQAFDNTKTPENEFQYEGWFGIKSLPEIKKIRETEKVFGYPFEGNISDSIKAHIFAVTKRWMDPNNDGNPDDGIDGMRLDVAEHVPLGFWRDFRKYVRSINPEFYLIGENWWTKWPDILMDPKPWVNGDVFDAVMHYHWYKPVRAYLNKGDDKIDINQLYTQLDTIYSSYRPSTQRAMMNLISSHDSERALSAMANSNKYKFQSKPPENRNYHTGKPNDLAYKKFKLLIFHQFTFVGSPHIWNGDEMGMWGADDPDNRKPLWWEEFDFEHETPIYPEQMPYNDKPNFNHEINNYYKQLCQLRKSYNGLSHGDYKFLREYIDNDIFAYERIYKNEKFIILINASELDKEIKLSSSNFKELMKIGNIKIEMDKINMGDYSAVIVKSN